MTANEIFEQMKDQWSEFEMNHDKFQNQGVKSSAARARKAIGEIKKLVTEYRKQSVSETKK